MRKSVLIGLTVFLVFSISFTLFLYDEIFNEITGRQIFLDDDFEQKPGAFRPSNTPTIALSPGNNCEIKSVYSSHKVARIGDITSIYVDGKDGTNCDGLDIEIKVYEKDYLFNDYVQTLSGKFLKNKGVIDWNIEDKFSYLFDEYLEGNELEFYFEFSIEDKIVSSDLLSVTYLSEEISLQPATPLADNQAYIRNPTSQAVTNHLVSIPIGFQQGEYNSSTISNFRLQGLTSQVQPTTYYSDGSIRTGIIHALVSLPPNTENIYDFIDSTSVQTFNYHSSVQNFFSQGEITVITRDLNGNSYPVTIPLSSLTPVVDGPVIKKYHYEKAHRKPSGSSNPLNYLFTSVFEIEIVSNQPWIKIQHLVVNSHNLAEDVQTGLNYADGQLGAIRYQNIEMYLDTNNPSNPSNTYVSLLGSGNALQPTSVDVKPSPESNRIWIMPTNGQQILFNNFNSYGQHANVNYNYINPGQGFLTEVTLWLDVVNNPPKTYDPIYENPLFFGTSLARFNLIPDGIFPDVPNPRLLGQDTNFRFDFNSLATTELNSYNSQRSNYGYRFGFAGINKFDLGSAGENGVNDEVSASFVKYLMSCNERCDNRLFQTTRLFKYGISYAGDLAIGFNPREHLLAQLYAYRTPLFTTLTGGDCNTKDFLGYCNVRTGTLAPNFVAGPGEGARQWTHQDDAHGGIGAGMSYYIATGDRMSYYITKQVYNTNVAHTNYGYLYGSSFQTRAFGRLAHSITHLYLAESDPLERNYLKLTANRLFPLVESRRDDSAPGTRGNHPVTGEPYAVGFVDYFTDGAGHTCPHGNTGQINGQCEARAFTWQEALVIGGLTNILRSVPVDDIPSAKNLIANLMDTHFTYAYKDYDEVRNFYPGLIPGTTIRDGTGYFAGGMVIGPPTAGYCTPPNCGSNQVPYTAAISTYYGDAFVDYNYPGYCLALKYAIDSNHPKKAEWEEKFSKAIKSFINVVSNNDASQFANLRGLSVVAGHFHQYICPVHYILGVPNAREVASPLYIDNDLDGFSEAIGDCNDNNNKIYPAAGETWEQSPGVFGCNDNIDANCNGLIDCDDPQCSISTWPPYNDFCRGTAPKAHLGDGVVQNPNFEGRAEQCDISYIGGSSSNSCVDGRCVGSFVYAEGNNGLCATGILPPPSAPSNLQVDGATFSQVNLYWTDNSNDESGFRIERSTSQTTGFAEVGINPANDNTFSDTTVSQNTNYYYRVRAYNGGGNSAYSNTVSAITPSAPSCSAQSGVICSSGQFCSGTSLPHSGSGTCCNVACTTGVPGLVGHWMFDDTVSPSDNAFDSSGNNLHGTCSSGTCPTYQSTGGQINGAFDFDGVDDRVVVADNNLLDLTTQGTIMAWVRMDTLGRWHGIIAKGNAPTHAYGVEIDNNRFVCQLNGVDYFINGVTLAAGNYYHIACSWSAGVLSVYVNGVPQTFSGSFSTPVANTGNLQIGTWPASGSNPWDWMDGRIDDVRVYNRGLSQAEIQSLISVPTVPNAPTGLAVSNPAQSSLTLTWQDNSNNENNFTVERRLVGGSFAVISTIAANVVSYVDTGLIAGTTYEYRVRANNDIGSSAYTSVISGTTSLGALDFAISSNPTSGTVQQSGNVQAVVTATYVSGNSASVIFSASNLPSGVTASFSPSSCTPSVGSSCTSTLTLSASAGTNIISNHQITIIGTSGSIIRTVSYGLNVTQLPPSTPTGLTVTTLSSSSLRIDWNDVSGESSYTIQRRTLPSGTFANVPGAGSLVANTVTFTDTALSSATSYEYRIQASNSGGSSSFSSPVTGTTSPNIPNSPAISGISLSISSWISSSLVTINGQNFDGNAQVFVNGVQVADSRLTRTSTTITFTRNAQEFNVGINPLMVVNPNSQLNVSNSFTLTSSPSLISVTPNVVTNNVLTVVNLTGNDFDPNSRVMLFGVVEVPSFLVTYVNPQLIQLSVIPGLEGANYEFSVLNGAGVNLSNSINIRVNYPFDYVVSSDVSQSTLNSGDSFSGTLKFETLLFMDHETIDLDFIAPSGISLVLTNNSCDFNLSIQPYPSCEISFSGTNSLAPGSYVIQFISNSSDTGIVRQVNVTVVVNSPSGTTSGSGSSGSGGSGGSGGSSGGSVRPSTTAYQCNDDVDNDGDGRVDFSEDTGCSTLNDNSELDPSEIVDEPTSTWTGEENPDELSGSGDVEVRVVFWTVLLLLIGGIVVVGFFVLRLLKPKENISNSLARSSFESR